MFIRKTLLIAVAAAVAAPAFAADSESRFRGRRIVEANCAVCHAIAQVDESENPDAPAFRALARLRPLAPLRKEMAGELFLRHAVMPDFEPTPEQVDDIVDFIESIQQ